MNKQLLLTNREAPNPENHSAEDVSAVFNAAFSVELATTPAAINEVLEVRYQVYCIDRPFEDPASFADKREHDLYDPRSVHALIRHKASGDGVAAVRLVLQGDDPASRFPMEGPCLDQMSPAARKRVWNTPRDQVAEISRLAVSREFRKRLNEQESTSGLSDFVSYTDTDGGRRAMPYISLGLFAAIVQMSVKHGITHWLAAMEPTLLRLLKRYGISFDHVGPTVDYHGRRRPVFSSAGSLLEGIREQRPDVWALITDSGRFVPGQVKPRQLLPSRTLFPIHNPGHALVA
ncbi:PEP-CTERM/exosortase system-associated acyltransferase [Hydrocarboniclastica marina]|uniref:PEP-CTERM/exosortase system-associated acyltransferase n=1 Tax=Hydrocarboniclastica marina TaxID=2259620 RepID=A0A4P7XK71_9ALTE|nr:PEP-CTERM/exosortase system-associated acyltransferase [Hydrocarboniclastica marina]MAL98975.1 GNAT family N-acetyltransferase [Alteromonadaceae bacterium]QCF26307.1 PEP-CTERM/exosortase system-associated acyltransferase [Hydrocarboniclastica marina]